jgi:uncharacterized membrane protein
MLHSVRHVNGAMLWANLHLLFWLSLFPFVTGWTGENHFAAMPTALYGVVLFMAAFAYWLLQFTIIKQQGKDSVLAKAVGKDYKGKLSPIIYILAIPLAFIDPWFANGLYVLVAIIWIVPDPRIERVLVNEE